MFAGWGAPKPAPQKDDAPPAVLDHERQKIMDWRRDNLEALGLPYPVALELAAVGTDWHIVARAMEKGATVKQVEAMFL